MNYCGQCGQPLQVNTGNSYAKKVCKSCNWKWYANPIPVVVVLVTTNDDQMVYARQNWFPEGKWSLVSGYVDQGESAEEAAVREVNEETGLDTEITDYLGTITSGDKPELYLMYHARVIGGKLQPGDDVDEVLINSISTEKLFEGTVAYKMVHDFLVYMR